MTHHHLEPLPHAPIAMVLGLLEHLGEVPGGREDLYKLGGPMGYELDDLLPVTEAGKRLGLVVVTAGDIELTEEGRVVALAEEPVRKRRLAARLEKMPLIADIQRAVEEGAGRAPRRQFLEELQQLYSPVEAQRQLATALEWARYGELFDYDADADDYVLPS